MVQTGEENISWDRARGANPSPSDYEVEAIVMRIIRTARYTPARLYGHFPIYHSKIYVIPFLILTPSTGHFY